MITAIIFLIYSQINQFKEIIDDFNFTIDKNMCLTLANANFSPIYTQ